jgi:hypothetical protein
MRRASEVSQATTEDLWCSCVPARVSPKARSDRHARPARTREKVHPVSSMVSCESREGDRKDVGASGKFFVTRHAVAQYRARIRPGIGYRQALRELTQLTTAGRLVGPATGFREFAGAELWRGPRVGPNRHSRGREPTPADPRDRLRFVAAHGPGDKPQVVTVLPIGRVMRRCE